MALPDQLGPSVLKPLFPFKGGIGLIELPRCVMFDKTDCDASCFPINYVERDLVKSLSVAKDVRKWNQSVNRV